MTSVFPTKADFEKLYKRPDAEVKDIWESLVETDRLSRCCAYHMFQVQAPQLEWFEAVHCEMELRDLPTEIVRQDEEGANCPTCGSDYETVDDLKAFMHIYRVCRSCRTRRKLGDHVDCRIGQLESLPEDW